MKTSLRISFIGILSVFVSALGAQTTFNYTGSMQTYVVPAGTTSITIETYGAQGGNAVTGGTGGMGAYATGVMPVTGGQTLYIYVGGQSGFNGGGNGGADGNDENSGGVSLRNAPNGGGASDVRVGGTALTDRVIVAGGGGGAGDNGVWQGCQVAGPAGNGGNGGMVGATGTFGVGTPCNCGGGGGDGGTGGTSVAGGNPGSYTGSTACLRSSWTIGGGGILGIGGDGSTTFYNGTGGGGGGGGGYYGGGSGANGSDTTPGGGGGGGSSFTGTLTAVTVTDGTRTGDGVIIITPNCVMATTVSSQTNVTCFGGNDGSATIAQSGGVGPFTYSWSPTGGNGATASGLSAGTYSCTVTASNGCMSTSTVNITEPPMLMLTASASNSPICFGASTTLNVSGASTYLWNPGALVGSSITVIPGTPITYTVTGTDVAGCTATETVSVVVYPLPVVNLGNDITQCGGSITLDAQNPGFTYLWNVGPTTQTITVGSSGTYSVTVTDPNGCSNSDAMVATFNTPPAINLGNDITQCGGNVTLDAGMGGATYLWNTIQNTQTISVSSTGNYYVDVTDINGCSGSDTIMVTINSIPTVTGTASANSVCLNDASVSLTGTPAGGTWSGTGVTGNSFNPLTAGNGAHVATYTYTDVNGCTNTATVTITVNACTGVAEQNPLSGISVYPNPNNGIFTITSTSEIGDMNIIITDLTGRMVYSSMEKNVSVGYSHEINISSESSGMYLLTVTKNGERHTEKISIGK